MELSPQVQEQIRMKVEEAQARLEAEVEKLKNTSGGEDAKKEVVEKFALFTRLLKQYELGIPPTPSDAQEAFEHLEDNIGILPRIVDALSVALKAIIESVIGILVTLRDGILSLFPKQDTKTSYVPDSALVRDGVVTFAMLPEMEATGTLVVPAVFAGTSEELRIPYAPSHSTFGVRVRRVSSTRACLHIESLSSVSHDIELAGLRLPPFLQSLDPHRPSFGTLDLESGEISGRMYSRLTDGMLYTVRSPILVRSTFTGRMFFDSGILRMSTQAIDFASDLPFRRVFQPRLVERTVLVREGLNERLVVPQRLTRPFESS
ncbi:hypothetical protein [Archangium violaceum]|uniref:Uncharacterized protein n=1 Tax=Archangium violaceum Cb vi76 TaxID=1406225 RepID=A0A084SV67_9BACT|nr:hypothetical protein [Archangium violaceum]KFA92352.1 hypothetical protein Q664_16265 [Archangium violaceum Cb vi76]